MERFARLVLSQGLKQVAKDKGAWVTGIIGSQNKDLMLQAWKEAIAFDSRRRLPEIKRPTLIIAGTADDAVAVHHARMLHAGIPDSTLVIIEGAGHALIWSHPEQLSRVASRFLVAPNGSHETAAPLAAS
jgi:pimeloyl-ACP methyl ester carboxylesterase